MSCGLLAGLLNILVELILNESHKYGAHNVPFTVTYAAYPVMNSSNVSPAFSVTWDLGERTIKK